MTSSEPAPSPRAPGAAVYDASSTDAAVPIDPQHTLRSDVLDREKARFGGFKFGAAFFGWLTATGSAVLLTALVGAIAAWIGLSSGASVDEVADVASGDAVTVRVVSAVMLALVLLVAYVAGGYVAGRMARFDGLKQGLAVWIWAVAIAIVVAIVSAIAGAQGGILGDVAGLPTIPVTPETATATAILTALGSAIVTLIGAIVGGMAGMRYHRRVDRAGLGR